MINFQEAINLIKENINRITPEETVPLALCSNRVLSQDIVSNEDLPLFDNSSMDGFAIRAEDVTEASVEWPKELQVIGESSAGKNFEGLVNINQSVRIMTGAKIPEGSNAVVEVESTSESDGIVSIRRSVQYGEMIRKKGENIHSGDISIPKGKLITSSDVGVLASLGINNVPVRTKPIIGILSSGNELIEPYKIPLENQIRNSSASAIYTAINESGGEPIDIGIAKDNKIDLLDKFEIGLRYDILITTGGVSMGKYDLLPEVLKEMGVEVLFYKVNIKPGKPIMFGTYKEPNAETCYVFSLPGNPVSSLVTYKLFVLPAIKLLLGDNSNQIKIKAILLHDINKNDNKSTLLEALFVTMKMGN